MRRDSSIKLTHSHQFKHVQLTCLLYRTFLLQKKYTTGFTELRQVVKPLFTEGKSLMKGL